MAVNNSISTILPNQDELWALGIENVADLLTAEFPVERYWLPLFLPRRTIMLLGGLSKIGKSWIVGSLARSLALGEPFLPPEPGYRATGSQNPRWKTPTPDRACRVLIVDKEVGRFSMKSRMDSILREDYAANPTGTTRLIRENLFVTSKDSGGDDFEGPNFSTPEGEELIHRQCEIIEPEVLILDPIGKMHEYEENSANQIQTLFNKVEKLLHANKKRNMSIMMLHHFGKPIRNPQGGQLGDPLDYNNFRGSTKFGDLPDGMITAAPIQQGNAVKGDSSKPIGQKGWDLKMRIKPRHDEEPPELVIGINQRGDNRVYFRRTL